MVCSGVIASASFKGSKRGWSINEPTPVGLKGDQTQPNTIPLTLVKRNTQRKCALFEVLCLEYTMLNFYSVCIKNSTGVAHPG